MEISALRVLCNLLRSMAKSQTQKEVMFRVNSNVWMIFLISEEQREILVVTLRALL